DRPTEGQCLSPTYDVGGLHVPHRASRLASMHSRDRGRSLDKRCRRQTTPRLSHRTVGGSRSTLATDVESVKLLLLAPPRAFPPLRPARLDAALQHRVLRLDGLVARLDRMRMDSGIHPDRVARARLDAQAAHDAAQLVDLEDRGRLLDPL